MKQSSSGLKRYTSADVAYAREYHENESLQAPNWVEAEDALALEAERDALKVENANLKGLIKWISTDVMPFTMAIVESGESRTDGYWMIDQIFSDGGPSHDMEDIRDEINDVVNGTGKGE